MFFWSWADPERDPTQKNQHTRKPSRGTESNRLLLRSLLLPQVPFFPFWTRGARLRGIGEAAPVGGEIGRFWRFSPWGGDVAPVGGEIGGFWRFSP